MFPDDSDDLLSRYKASPLEKPVKLTSMFTKRKVSISRKEIGLTALQKLAQNSSLASPALKAMESDLASSLMPELLPQQIFNEKKIKRTLGALRPRIECPEGIIDVGKHNQTSWEPLDWDKLHDHVGSNMEWDNAACVLHQDVFEEFQGYDSVPVRKSSEGTINSTDSMDRDRDTTLYDSNSSSHDSSHGFLSDNKRSGGSDRVLLTGNSRSLGSNASFQNPPPRNIVGKGKKKHDREQYDPEEDVDASI